MKKSAPVSLLILLSALFLPVHAIALEQPGCTDPLALNYNPEATENDGSCQYNSASIDYEARERLPASVEETSGLISWNNQLWTHNDDTDLSIYGFSFDDVNAQEPILLEGLTNTDWEEMQQDSAYIYMGDIGNNSGSRTDLKFYKIEKASLTDDEPGIVADSIMYSYEDQEDFDPPGMMQTDFDAEAFAVTDEALFIFTKQWVSRKTAVYRVPNEAGTHVAEKVAEYDVDGLITGLTYFPEYRLMVLTGYNYPEMAPPFVLLLYDFEGTDFFGANKRELSMPDQIGHQIEAISSTDGLHYFVTNERFSNSGFVIPHRIFLFDLSTFLEDYLSETGPPYTSEGNPQPNLPSGLKLHQNYPNPFNPATKIAYELPEAGQVRLEVYNALGERVATLVNARQRAGRHEVRFDAAGLASGLYFYRLSSGSAQLTQRMTLLK